MLGRRLGLGVGLRVPRRVSACLGFLALAWRRARGPLAGGPQRRWLVQWAGRIRKRNGAGQGRRRGGCGIADRDRDLGPPPAVRLAFRVMSGGRTGDSRDPARSLLGLVVSVLVWVGFATRRVHLGSGLFSGYSYGLLNSCPTP